MSTIAWKGVNSCIFWRTKSKFTPVTPRIHRNLLAILNCPPCSLRLHSRIYVPWSLSKNERKTAWQPGRHLLEFIAVILWNASCIHAKSVERRRVPADHLLLDSALNLVPLISRWEMNKFENCWLKCQVFRCSKAFVSAIFEVVEFPTRYEWSSIRRSVQ
jgi:hypothetical protein